MDNNSNQASHVTKYLLKYVMCKSMCHVCHVWSFVTEIMGASMEDCLMVFIFIF